MLPNRTELVGCNVDRLSWCGTTKPVNAFIFYLPYIVFFGIGLSSINISLNTLFSKIIGPRPQAVQQAWLMVAGTSARMVGPLIIT